MSLRSPSLFIAVLSTAVVLFVAYGYVNRTSPGPLTTAHARIDALGGVGACSNCHGGWFESMTDACLECHQPVADQIEERDGLHGALPPKQAKQCAPCHSDHHGGNFAIVNRVSFQLAGIDDPEKFDHQLIGFAMAGPHTELSCEKCHEHADAQPLPEGAGRFVGLDQDCSTCHEDAHEGRMTLACASCHGQVAFDQFDSLGHEKFLPLSGGHGALECRTCHAKDNTHSLEALGRGRRRNARQCLDCHESPHDEGFVTRVAASAREDRKASCAVCHLPEHKTFRDGATTTPAQHALSGFSLALPHDLAKCEQCHAPDRSKFAERYPGREADACKQCHKDPHGGQFKRGDDEKRCIDCHDRLRFEPHAFTVAKHAETGLPLTGTHLDTECNNCHEVEWEGRARLFRGTAKLCEACHEDAHSGFFKRHDAELLKTPGGTCAACHNTNVFAEVADKEFEHGRWTGFFVKGAHAQGECEDCHPRATTPDENGRAFGRVIDHFGRFTGCETCHTDPHAGGFDKPKHPRRLEGRVGCERCHIQATFRTLPHGFDHGRWTDFDLKHAHKAAACSACHKRLRKPDALGRTWDPAKGHRCADCHRDPHAGQFERKGATDCRKCHARSTSFLDVAFRHDFDSRFRLGEAHAEVACDACHKKSKIAGTFVVRYRPLGRECSNCHADQNDPLRKRRARSNEEESR